MNLSKGLIKKKQNNVFISNIQVIILIVSFIYIISITKLINTAVTTIRAVNFSQTDLEFSCY